MGVVVKGQGNKLDHESITTIYSEVAPMRGQAALGGLLLKQRYPTVTPLPGPVQCS
jgi:hypothetical protein